MQLRILPLLLAASGCQLLEEDTTLHDTRGGFHDVTVSWSLKNLDGSKMAACPQGFNLVVVHLYELGLVEPPDALIKLPCTPEGSTTQPVATSGYLPDPMDNLARYTYGPQKDIWLDITEETQSEEAAISYTYFVGDLDKDMSIHFDIYPAGGVGVAIWQLQSKFTNAPIPSCASGDVDEIEAWVRRYDAGENAPFVFAGKWPCENVDPYFYYYPDSNFTTFSDKLNLGSGHTSPLPPGDYEAELRAKRRGAQVGIGKGYYIGTDENSFHAINADPITIEDR